MRRNSKLISWISLPFCYRGYPITNPMPSVLMPLARMILTLKGESNTRSMIQTAGFYIHLYSLWHVIRHNITKSVFGCVISLTGKCPGNLGGRSHSEMQTDQQALGLGENSPQVLGTSHELSFWSGHRYFIREGARINMTPNSKEALRICRQLL